MGRRTNKQAKSRQWAQRHVDDPYVKQAVKAGFRARAVYKLEEIDLRYRLIRSGMNVLDLGAAPGSWSQYAAGKTGASGCVVAVDLLHMAPIEQVMILQGDFCEPGVQAAILDQLGGKPADLVISDMAPDLTGISITDQSNMERLLDSVIETQPALLKPGGNLLVKVFEGEVAGQVRKLLGQGFAHVNTIKPKASRKHSREFYLLAQKQRITG